MVINLLYKSFCEADTKKIAYELAKKSKAGDIFCLDGDLGSGKTFFVKEFANALNIKDYISSPTFNIINEYNSGKINLYHFDVYRISNIDELDYTNYQDYFYGKGICMIEWAEIIKDVIPDYATWIYFSRDLSLGENYRLINII